MMESAPERNKATVLEGFDTLFNKRPRRKREESVFRAGGDVVLVDGPDLAS